MRPYIILLLLALLFAVPVYAVSSGDVGESVVNIFVTSNTSFFNVTNVTNITFLNVTNITNIFNVTNVTNVTEINGSLILNPLDPAIVVSNGMNGSATNISLNYSFVQARVNGTCSGNNFFQGVFQNGSVDCGSASSGTGNITGTGVAGNLSYWTSGSNLATSNVLQNSSGIFVLSDFYANYLFGDGSNLTGIPTFAYIMSMNTTIYEHLAALNASILNISSSGNGTLTSVNVVGPYLGGGNITNYGNVTFNESLLNTTINNISIIREIVYNTSCVVVVSNCSAVTSSIHFQITNIVVTPVNLSGTYRFEMTEYPNASNVIDTNRIPHNTVWNIQKNYAIDGQSQVNITSANAGSSFNFAITYLTNGVQ